MARMIQIRNVPDELHRKLKVRAATRSADFLNPNRANARSWISLLFPSHAMRTLLSSRARGNCDHPSLPMMPSTSRSRKCSMRRSSLATLGWRDRTGIARGSRSSSRQHESRHHVAGELDAQAQRRIAVGAAVAGGGLAQHGAHLWRFRADVQALQLDAPLEEEDMDFRKLVGGGVEDEHRRPRAVLRIVIDDVLADRGVAAEALEH